MKIEFPFIAVDWGTSHMRAVLCAGNELDTKSAVIVTDDGIANLKQSPSEVLFDAIEPWTTKLGKMDILLGGMVGSNIGWRETPYMSCPLSPEDLTGGLNTFEAQGHRIAIVPGLSCVNTLGQPDVMRGEEIQVLGWMLQNENARMADRLLCLPGTHTKWVRLQNGRITRFTTSLTGELFALLRQHSVLVPKSEVGADVVVDREAFQQGLDLVSKYGDDLLHVLFSTRSRKLINNDDFGDASSYLSGLLIGADVRSALRGNDVGGANIELIGVPQLCEKFAMAIKQMGYTSKVTDGSNAVHAGFLAIAAGET